MLRAVLHTAQILSIKEAFISDIISPKLKVLIPVSWYLSLLYRRYLHCLSLDNLYLLLFASGPVEPGSIWNPAAASKGPVRNPLLPPLPALTHPGWHAL